MEEIVKTIMAFIKNHSVLSYFSLTFIISWGGVIILGAPYGMPATSALFEKHWPVVFLPYLLGPSISSFLLTGLMSGWAGLRELFSRLLKWRASAGWYAVALLTAPLLVSAILFPMSLISPVYLPDIVTKADKIGLILLGTMVGFIFGGLAEELGWTGFALPRLRKRYSIFSTGLIVGSVWGIWHILPTYWGSGGMNGVLDLSLLLPPCLFYAGVLPSYRILMVWLYDRCGSLPLVMLMHGSLTASTLFILSPAVRGLSLAIYYVILTAVMWIAASAVIAVNRRQTLRP